MNSESTNMFRFSLLVRCLVKYMSQCIWYIDEQIKISVSYSYFTFYIHTIKIDWLYTIVRSCCIMSEEYPTFADGNIDESRLGDGGMAAV